MHNSDRLFCVHPFNGLTVSRTGDAYACCADWLPVPLGNVLRTPLMEVWRGREATRLRVSVLDQSFRFCRATCPYLANPRGPVVRGVRLRSPPDLSRVGELKLSYDPTCNLRCANCRTGAVGASELTGRIHAEVARADVLSHVGRLYVAGYGDPVFTDLEYQERAVHLPSHPRHGKLLEVLRDPVFRDPRVVLGDFLS